MSVPALRLRRAGGLLDLPWEVPLAGWPDDLGFRQQPVRPSRHLEAPASDEEIHGDAGGGASSDADLDPLPGAAVDDLVE